MRVRVAGITKNKSSGIYQFRMAVPEQFRAVVGHREFKETLGTKDLGVAKVRHARKLAEIQSYLASLTRDADDLVIGQAERICRQGFEAMTARNLREHDDGVTEVADARSNVILGMLTFLSYRARMTWGVDHADLAELQVFGEISNDNSALEPIAILDTREQDTVAAIISDKEGRFEVIRHIDDGREVRGLTGNPKTQGLGHREIAVALLKQEDWRAVEMEVMLVAHAVNATVPLNTPLYNALARRVLQELVEHRFASWRSDKTRKEAHEGSQRRFISTLPPTGQDALHLLSDALEKWRAGKGLKEDGASKTSDEWKLAFNRFVKLFGDPPVDQITRAMMLDFRDALMKLPSRPKRSIAALGLEKQAAIAAKDGLPTLSPNSVEKNISAIRSLLAVAVERDWIDRNVASNINVEDAGYVGDERDYYSSSDMATIYTSALLTDPDACSDTMFFILLLAPFQGTRPGETCSLKPSEVLIEDGVPIMRIRRKDGRRKKTTSSVRDVPVHWIAVEAGFMDFATLKQQSKAQWLFDDLQPDKYGDRFKLLSRAINARIRALGINEPDKAFYSTRHTMKRAQRKERIAEQNADQMTGHGSRNVGRKYGQGVPDEILKEDIDKLWFEGVDWDAVVLCGLTRVARLREQLNN